MKKTINVKLDDQTITISKLPLGKYAELLRSVRELPKNLSNFGDLTSEMTLVKLPEIIADSLPDFLKILNIATGLKPEQLEQLGLDEITKLIVGVIEVNNYKEIYNTLKKVTARPDKIPTSGFITQ
jgi:hypothetical protein